MTVSIFNCSTIFILLWYYFDSEIFLLSKNSPRLKRQTLHSIALRAMRLKNELFKLFFNTKLIICNYCQVFILAIINIEYYLPTHRFIFSRFENACSFEVCILHTQQFFSVGKILLVIYNIIIR